MPERVFDNPGRLAQIVGDSIITQGLQIDVIEVERGQETGAGMGLFLYGRPNKVAEGSYERLHVLGMDVAAKLAAAVLIVGTNTWGVEFAGPVNEMIADPTTVPGVTDSGIVVPDTGIVDRIRRRGH